jgi:hypothetical protein
VDCGVFRRSQNKDRQIPSLTANGPGGDVFCSSAFFFNILLSAKGMLGYPAVQFSPRPWY